ncbi:ABC transporter ATP-binding protein [Salininema proteolyticum]|uniref:ABC transporter ATP-binding protein n=1 Tax=Salininema proteolyticum TaxID=1607685 RepID=A0ABV8U3Z4_9ACTN
MSEPLLSVEGLEVSYGRVRAVQGVSFEVEAESLVALIGANGAGKTSAMSAVAGLLKPSGGRILFRGKDVTKTPAHRMVAQGLVLVPEGRQILTTLTVEENLKLARTARTSGPGKIDDVYGMFPILGERRSFSAGSLSGGEQQMLAIGRALVAEPEMMLLDEPTMGLAPKMVDVVFDAVEEIRESGVTVVLVEQNAQRALRAADKGYVVEGGRVSLSGDPEELLESDEVRKAYLGL